MKKRILALLLAAGMTLGLAACGGGTQGSSETPAGGGETGSGGGNVCVTATSFNIGGFTESSSWDSIIAAFKEANPGIDVTVNAINYQDRVAVLSSTITSGTAPDVIFEGP